MNMDNNKFSMEKVFKINKDSTTSAYVQHQCHGCRGWQHDGRQPSYTCGDIQDGAADGTIVYFGKFYNGIDKEDSFVEHQLSIEIIEDIF